ncbi:hypothetical protein C3B55_00640 [Candidatus Pseudomonas adelgestsugas]|uniref:ABC transporter permease n=1 Tax=Candidatus Pseudomonas adelgestsugas TaxID=1302376 RepID=A0ABX5R8J2_9PSED|nr:hypothetical protein C3B55_00640 [Candidatus Pseudomonas adelgestsugas]
MRNAGFLLEYMMVRKKVVGLAINLVLLVLVTQFY